MSAGLWQCLNFSLRNGEAKQTELSAFRSKLNRRTTVWPAVHSILFQHWLHLKQTLSRSVHLSQRERNLRKSVDLNSINKSSLSHCYFSDRCFHQVLGKLKSFHSLVTCVGVVSRPESKLWECSFGWVRGLKGHRSPCYKRAAQSMAFFYCKSI